MLEIDNLHCKIDGKSILKGVNLKIKKGEIHAIMGPNGSGKSTLANVISGHEDYEVTKGSIYFDNNEINEGIIFYQLKEYLQKISDEALYAYNVYQIEGEGRKLFSSIDGDEDTIMGLPIKKIKEYIENYK